MTRVLENIFEKNMRFDFLCNGFKSFSLKEEQYITM